MQAIGRGPFGDVSTRLHRFELSIVRTDGVAQLLQTQGDFAIDDEKILQLGDRRCKDARDQQRPVRKQAMKILEKKIGRQVSATQHADQDQQSPQAGISHHNPK